MENSRYQFLLTILFMQLTNVDLEIVRAIRNRDINLDIKCPLTDYSIVEVLSPTHGKENCEDSLVKFLSSYSLRDAK